MQRNLLIYTHRPLSRTLQNYTTPVTARRMTTATFKYLDPKSTDPSPTAVFPRRPWTKVDGGGHGFKLADHSRQVNNLRGQEDKFHTDLSGFSVHHAPSNEKEFTSDAAIRSGYYAEVEQLLRSQLNGIKKVVIFDHTVRRRQKDSPRQPVQQVHIDQTPNAAAVRVRRHLPAEEAEELLKGRYQIINVWRPIGHPASDFPLAVVDWRTMAPTDLINVDLLYPKRDETDDGDDRGKEALPMGEGTEGYEPRGETYGIAPNEAHKFYYYKDMKPEEAMFLKIFDSRGQGLPGGKDGVAVGSAHTAFIDPATPADAKGRQSIEVRCLVFYE